jgi:hypothetical protein
MNKRWTIEDDKRYFELLIVFKDLKLVGPNDFENLDWVSYELAIQDPMGDIWNSLRKNKGSLPTP